MGVNRSMRKSKDNHSEGFGDELQTATICHATRLLPLIATVRSTAVACIHRLSPPTLFESWAGVGTFKNPNLPPTQLPQPPSNLAGTRGKSSKLKPSVAPGQRTNDGGLREESDIKTGSAKFHRTFRVQASAHTRRERENEQSRARGLPYGI